MKRVNYKLFTLLTVLSFMVISTSCVKEEFLKVCYDNTQTGCVNLNNSTSNTPLKTVNFSSTSGTYSEAVGGISFTVELSEPHDLDIEVPFTVTGTLDYESNNDVEITGLNVVFNSTTGLGTLTIPAGFSSQSITYNIVNDNKSEDSETSTITLGIPTNATLGTSTTYNLTIADDDDDSIVEFVTTTSSFGENVGIATIDIFLDKETGKEITIPVTISGTATYGSDHGLNTLQITIPADSDSYEINFSILTDSNDESDETITINMISATNATLGSNTSHQVTIVDNDDPPYVIFTSSFGVYEEDEGAVNINVSLTEVSEVDVDFDISVSGNSDALDHNLSAGSYTIPAGETDIDIPVTIIDDLTAEVDETLVVTLENPTNAFLSPAVSYTMIIQDNEIAPQVSFRSAAQSYYEGARKANFCFELDKPAGSDITVPYTLSILSTATAGTHHNLADGSVVIEKNHTQNCVVFDLDNTTDPGHGYNKTVVVDMGTPTGATKGLILEHKITILDPMMVQVPADYNLINGDGNFKDLVSNRVNSVFVDDDNHMFVATENGLSYAVEGTGQDGLRSVGSGLGLKDINIKAVYFDDENLVAALATEGGVALSYNLLQAGCEDETLVNKTTCEAAADRVWMDDILDDDSDYCLMTTHMNSQTCGLAGKTWKDPMSYFGAGFDFYTTAQGLASNKAHSIVVSGKNIMVATDVGFSVSKNSGSSWTNYTTITGITFTKINKLHYDKTNKVVTILTDGGMAQTSDWGATYTNLFDDTNYLPSDDVIAYDRLGANAYILTDDGLAYGDISTPASFTKKTLVDIGFAAEPTKLRDLAVSKTGLVYILGTDRFVYTPDNTISSFTSLTTLSSIVFSNNKSMDLVNNALATDYVIIATETNGLLSIDMNIGLPDSMSKIETNIGLSNNNISSIDYDSNQYLYVGTEYGLNYTDNTNYNSFNRNTSIYNGKINSVRVRADDKIFVTTDGGYAITTNPASFLLTNNAINTSLPQNELSDMISFFDGANYHYAVGTQASGVYLKKAGDGTYDNNNNVLGGITRNVVTVPSLLSNFVTALGHDPQKNRFWIGNTGGGISFTDDVFDSFTNFFPAGAGVVNAIKDVDDGSTIGHVYIGTSTGLYQSNNFYEDDKDATCSAGSDGNPDDYCEFFSISNGMNSSNILALDVKDNAGSHIIMVGTDDGLSFSTDMGSSFQTFGTESGLPSNKVQAVRILPSGKVFVGTDKGLAVLRESF